MDTIAFVSEKRHYSVSEFHDIFHSSLPKVIEVSQGVCSNTGEETFGKGEVLVIAGISRQRRVITKCEINHRDKLLSIPETFTEKLCVVKKGIPGKEDLLVNILAHNRLPVSVCFPRNRTISLGENRTTTNRIPHLQLTETFDEVFLLGNYINDGELCKDVVPVPLYLSQLRFSIVTGIKDQSVGKWKHYKRDLNHKCSFIKYDREFGSPDIAEYNPLAVHSGKALTYLEPMTYENIVNLVQVISPQDIYPGMTPEQIDELGLYEDLPLHGSAEPEDKNPLKKHVKKCPHTSIRLPQSTKTGQQIQTTEPVKPTQQVAKTRPPIAPKPVLKPSKQEPSSVKGKESAPLVPDRQASCFREAKAKLQDEFHNKYANVLPTSSVAPTIDPRRMIPKVRSPEKAKSKSHKILPVVNCKEDVARLSVENVCEYLKLLNLSQYEERFKEHLIDGALLQGLEPDLFIEDIGMKKIEVIRLMYFSKEGRLPVCS